MNTLKKLLITAACFAAIPATSFARDEIQIAGSSTVLPYAQIVAEAFGESFPFPTPIVASGGSSSGLKAFCEGLGPNTIDIANSSRPIRDSEREACAANGVTDIIEVQFGYDGIVFASDIEGPSFDFDPEDWYEAMAAQIVEDGRLIDNPYTTWNEIDDDFPAWEIAAYIPGENHGTREVFEEKVLLAGCKEEGAFAEMIELGMSEDDAEDACIRVRKDGRAIDIVGDYSETLSRIDANKTGIGVFGLAFYENNMDRLRVATMDDVVPTVETISSGVYPVSRPLYFYVKKGHLDIIPGLQEYIEFFVSDQVSGPTGPLASYGLVASPKNERESLQARVASGEIMQ